MTTTTASIELSTSEALSADEGRGLAGALQHAHVMRRRIARAGEVVVGWYRAGQVGGDTSIELARWSGARR